MPRVVALVADLMDRSRVSGALPDVQFVADPSSVGGADVVIVDLGRYADAVTEVRAVAPTAFVVAYGVHVDDATLAGARAAGPDRVLSRSKFFRDPAAAVVCTE